VSKTPGSRGSGGAEERRFFERELLYGETAETIGALLRELGVTQKELADRLGLSEARVSRILNARENMTLRTLTDVAWALGFRFVPTLVPFEDRSRTPAANDPPPPAWIERQRQLVARSRQAVGPKRPPQARDD
jgi:transcriptional regulator with XRE-family HTH domain